jgi:HEPN domain-containing protein
MSPESWDLAKVWLAKAHSDLASARLLITGRERHLDTGSYHCQQAAEKAIKAWLTASEVIFTKTHSLEILLRLCIPSAPGLQQFLFHAEELTPFATEYRYPGDIFEPSAAEARNALLLAEEITFWISSEIAKIPRPDAQGNP